MIQNLVDFLTAKGAFQTKHSGRRLGDHLLNTFELLIENKAPKTVAIAGGLHSIYGTNAFKQITTSDRTEIQQHFGETTERLAYLFSIINRPKGLEDGHPKHWQTGEDVFVSPEELHYLCLIEAANLKEQRISLLRYPCINNAWKSLKYGSL